MRRAGRSALLAASALCAAAMLHATGWSQAGPKQPGVVDEVAGQVPAQAEQAQRAPVTGDAAAADEHASRVLAGLEELPRPGGDEHETIGTAFGAASSSFAFFASGAIIPVLPYLFGFQGLTAVVISAALVGIALLGTGSVVGLLSGSSPLKRALRQLAIGYGAAGATYLLGLLFGVSAA